jgi:hypothetical protein
MQISAEKPPAWDERREAARIGRIGESSHGSHAEHPLLWRRLAV